jgi:hypothetical protein
MKLLRHGVAALALIFVPGAPIPVMDTDGKVPDLKIEVVGFKDPSNQRDVVIRVTNVSQSWSTETRATVVTVEPGPANKVDLRVPDLDPNWAPKPQGETDFKFEFTYTLTGPCDGHTIKATLTTGKDWEGDPEKNVANNTVQKQLCSAKAQVTSTPTATPTATATPDQSQFANPNTNIASIRPGRLPAALAVEGANAQATAAALAATPEAMRPGEHTLELAPSALKGLELQKFEGLFAPFGSDSIDGTRVGWFQHESDSLFSNSSVVQVAQVAVNFDLGTLDEIANKTIKDAVLTYTETPAAWQSASGDFEAKGGCVEILGRATAVWDGQNLKTLFPNELILGPRAGGGTEWAVKDYVAGWANNTRPRLGFVLRGGNEDPHGDDNTSCMSTISDIKLTIRYEVPR